MPQYNKGSENLSEELVSTEKLIKRAFPKGVEESDVIGLIDALYDHMSNRQLARVVSRVSGLDENRVMNDVYHVGAAIHTRPRDNTILTKLRAAGFDEWIRES